MTIRNRLALRFMLLATLILGGCFAAVYFFSAQFRTEEFYGRLRDRATNIAKLLIQVDEVDIALLNKIEHDNPVRLPEEGIRIFDHENTELFQNGDLRGLTVTSAFLDSVRLEHEIRFQRGDQELLGFLFTDRYDRFVVVTAARDIYGRSKLRNQAQVMLLTFAVGVVLTFFIGRSYAQRALRPLKRLVDELNAVSVRDLSQRVDEGTGHDEIAQLAASFNGLLARLEEAFQAQRNFIANASHELRTPLTAISGQLEVVLLKERSAMDYRAVTTSVLDDMRALNGLSNRLLLMAQADSAAPQATFAPVRIDETVWQARAEVMRSRKGYTVDVHLGDVDDDRQLTVQGNENLLRSLVTNLMENACKYADDHHVDVSIVPGLEHVELHFLDRGIGIPPGEQAQIFEPFRRGSNTGGRQGHGIGLPLARRIAELHKGRITLNARPNGGTAFVVRLPHA